MTRAFRGWRCGLARAVLGRWVGLVLRLVCEVRVSVLCVCPGSPRGLLHFGEGREGRWPMAARHGHRLGPRDPRSRLRGRPAAAPRSPSDQLPVTLYWSPRPRARSSPPSTAPCERLVSTHARRSPMTPPGMATVWPLAVLPPVHPDLPCYGGYLSGRRSRGRDYHISRRTRHELQAHHGHVALLNRPRAGV